MTMRSFTTAALSQTLASNFEMEPGERPPFNLDEYVDWATVKACNHQLGTYQRRVLLLLTNHWVLSAMQIYMFGFISEEPDVGGISGRRLKLPDGANECTQTQRDFYGESCPELSSTTCELQLGDMWEFRDPQNSIKAEFNLHECSGQGNVVEFIGTVYYWVYGVGEVLGGVVSDDIGRKKAYWSFLVLQLLGSISVAMAPNIWLFGAGRMVQSFGIGGFGVVGFVWASESLNAEALHYLAWAPGAWFILGGCIPAILTLWVSDWRVYCWLIVLFSIPNFFLPLLYFESPKWLATTKDRKRIWDVMAGICQANGKPPPLGPPETNYVVTRSKIGLDDNVEAWQEQKVNEGWASLVHPKILPRLTVTCLAWFAMSFAYYGISSFDPPELFPNSRVISWCVGFAVELPANIAAGYLIEQPSFGRKTVGAGGLVLAALALGVASLKPLSPLGMEWLFTGCYYVGRMSVAAAYGTLWPWSAEIFPNSIRNTAMGVNALFASMGSSLAPWMGTIDNFSVRMVAFAIPSAVVGVFSFIKLPETRGKLLPGYVADLED